MDRVIWGNTIESYLWTIGIILFVLLLNRVISRYFARLVFKIFRSAFRCTTGKSLPI
jgi:hypothetical protein